MRQTYLTYISGLFWEGGGHHLQLNWSLMFWENMTFHICLDPTAHLLSASLHHPPTAYITFNCVRSCRAQAASSAQIKSAKCFVQGAETTLSKRTFNFSQGAPAHLHVWRRRHGVCASSLLHHETCKNVIPSVHIVFRKYCIPIKCAVTALHMKKSQPNHFQFCRNYFCFFGRFFSLLHYLN